MRKLVDFAAYTGETQKRFCCTRSGCNTTFVPMNIPAHIQQLEQLERQGSTLLKEMDKQKKEKDYVALSVTLQKVKTLNRRLSAATAKKR